MKLRKKYPNIFIALSFCLAAVCVGAITAGVSGKPTVNEAENFTRLTVQWSELPEPDTGNVNNEVEGIPDERTTEKKIERNKPYSGNFLLPVGTDIIKDFSNGEMVPSKTMGDWRVHNGVDFASSVGNEVHAVSDGVVTEVKEDGFWGTIVEIDHGNMMTVRYCGLKNGSCLTAGTKVEQGDRIGNLGHIPIEISDGDHLHLEVIIDGEIVDPLEALNKTGADE